MSAPTRAQVDDAVRLVRNTVKRSLREQRDAALVALLDALYLALAQAQADSGVLARLRDAVSHDDITVIEQAMDKALGDPFGGTTCDALRAALDAARVGA